MDKILEKLKADKNVLNIYEQSDLGNQRIVDILN